MSAQTGKLPTGAFKLSLIATALLSVGGVGYARDAASASAPIAATAVRNDFNDATLNDRYGFHVIAVSAGKYSFAIAGYYQFFGDGTMLGRDVVSFTGFKPAIGVTEREYRGTYHVNPDGTGSLTLDISPTFQPQAHFVIVKDGEEVEIVFAVENNANAFTLKKQSLGD